MPRIHRPGHILAVAHDGPVLLLVQVTGCTQPSPLRPTSPASLARPRRLGAPVAILYGWVPARSANLGHGVLKQ
jgi:hypothetical protein